MWRTRFSSNCRNFPLLFAKSARSESDQVKSVVISRELNTDWDYHWKAVTARHPAVEQSARM